MANASEFIYTIKAEYAGSADMKKLTDDLNKISQIKSFDKLSGDIAKTETALTAAQKKAADLRAEMEKTGTASASNAFAKASAGADKLSATLAAQKTQLAGYSDSLKKAGLNTDQLSAAQKTLSSSASKWGTQLAAESTLGVRSFATIKSEIAGLNTAYSTLASSGGKSLSELAIAKQALLAKTKLLNAEMVGGNFRVMEATRGVSSLFKSLATDVIRVGVVAAAAAAGGLYAFSRMLSSAVDQAAKMGAIERSFIAISGSGKLAGEEMKFVEGEARKLGLELVSTATAYKGIWAASKGTQLEGEATRKIFSSIASASSALGLSADQTSGALMAISQMMSKGKIQAEELRGQLGERLPGAFNLMAKAAGVSAAQLDKMLVAGTVGIDILPRFAQILTETYGKSAVGANSYQKSLQQLKNEFGLLKTSIGESITNNTFVIESMKVVAGILEQQKENIVNNRQEWMDWGKRSALAVLEFAADFAQGIGSVYKGLEQTAGVLNIAYAGAVKLGQGYQYLFEQSNRAFGDTKKAEYWAQAQKESARIVEEAMTRAAKDFENADLGLPGLEKASGRIRELEAQLKKIPAAYKTTAEQMGGAVEEVPQEMEKVGGVWQQVTTKMSKDTKAVGEGVINLGGTLADYERQAQQVKDQLAAQTTALPPVDTKAIDDGIASTVEKGKAGFKDLFSSASEDSKGFFAAFAEKNNIFGTIFSDAAKSSHDSFNGMFDYLGKVSVSSLDSLGKYWSETWDGAKITTLSAIADIEQKLKELTRDRTVVIHVKEVGGGGGDSTDGYARGGDPFFGGLRGYGGGDRRLILVEDGEHVIRKEAVARLGHPFFQNFNTPNFPSKLPSLNLGRFAEGGAITAQAGYQGGESHQHFHFAGNVSPMSQQTARENVRVILNEMERQNRRRS